MDERNDYNSLIDEKIITGRINWQPMREIRNDTISNDILNEKLNLIIRRLNSIEEKMKPCELYGEDEMLEDLSNRLASFDYKPQETYTLGVDTYKKCKACGGQGIIVLNYRDSHSEGAISLCGYCEGSGIIKTKNK